MRRAEIITAFLLGVLSLYLMYKSGEPPSWNPDAGRFANVGFIEGEGPGSGFWPFWLSLVMFVSCVWIVVNWFRRSSPPSRSDDVYLDSYGKKMVLQIGGGLLGFLILISLIGFYGAMPLFLVYHLRLLSGHGWFATLSIALLTPIFCFLFFDIAMRIVLPKGYLEPLFLPIYDIFF